MFNSSNRRVIEINKSSTTVHAEDSREKNTSLAEEEAKEDMKARNKEFRFREYGNRARQHFPRITNVGGPVSFFNPTRALVQGGQSEQWTRLDSSTHSSLAAANSPEENKRGKPFRRIGLIWTSRNNRKGRHVLAISNPREAFKRAISDKHLSLWIRLRHICWRMFSSFPYWDISYVNAVLLVIGSLLWVVNGLFTLLPLVKPESEFRGQSVATKIIAFIAVNVFLVSNSLQVLESVNEYRRVCWGWDSHLKLDAESGFQAEIRPSSCEHHHANESHFLGYEDHTSQEPESEDLHPAPSYEADGYTAEEAAPTTSKSPESHKNPNNSYEPASPTGSTSSDESTTANGYGSQEALMPKKSHAKEEKNESMKPTKRSSWSFFPSRKDFVTHFIRDIGWLACAIQLVSATIFWIGNLIQLPPIYNQIDSIQELGSVWVPKLTGGIGFVISGLLFMAETQQTWWTPEPRDIGWNIGALSFIGGVGFTLSAGFGMYPPTWAQIQSAIATLWGSLTFFIAGVLQWYESLEKFSVTTEDNWDGESDDGGHGNCDDE